LRSHHLFSKKKWERGSNGFAYLGIRNPCLTINYLLAHTALPSLRFQLAQLGKGASRFPIERNNTFVPGQSSYMLDPPDAASFSLNSKSKHQHQRSASDKSLLTGEGSRSTLAGAGAAAVGVAGASHRMRVKRDLADSRSARTMVRFVSCCCGVIEKEKLTRNGHIPVIYCGDPSFKDRAWCLQIPY
jgi:hypothetical protein